ncbi:MAG: response regulator transcription factor [Clostridiales bacterium]|jgi:DNA-binding response OmpR family regulator|nr:response regulator transcription factor [Clostridiales bacterium]
MKRTTVLVVDDESRMRKLIGDFLLDKGFAVLEAEDGEKALEIFSGSQKIDLILLDVMMPRLDGWAVCREIRAMSAVPIIMLTARGDERDELLGFELGVDEYVSKPFSPKILVARAEALLRRTAAKTDAVELRGVTLDRAGHMIKVDGKPVSFTVKEFELLEYLIANAGIALSRDKILNNVWAYDYFGDARTVDTHIKKVRGKLGGRGKYIKTVWGMGYKFEVAE